jgi:hypothetical protein
LKIYTIAENTFVFVPPWVLQLLINTIKHCTVYGLALGEALGPILGAVLGTVLGPELGEALGEVLGPDEH